jgi:hypothetical protein
MRTTNCPECRWVSVTDANGRQRLEMRWQGAAPVSRLPVAGAAGSRAA